MRAGKSERLERDRRSQRVQTRGGGKAGATEYLRKGWLLSTNSIADVGSETTALGTAAPERLKHLSAQPGIEPQSFFMPSLLQGFPCAQQSE
jgi:hypothetical protein